MSEPPDLIQNGMATAAVVSQNIVDSRDPNRNNLRVTGDDPTTKIDSNPGGTALLRYPENIAGYYMSFAFEEYRRPSQFQGLQRNGLTDYIVLPLPNNLRDNSSLDYGETKGNFIIETLTPTMHNLGDSITSGKDLENKITGAFKTLTTEGLNATGQVGSGQTIRNLLNTTASGLNAVGGGNSGDDFVRGGLQLAGLADNPFTTVSFSGPRFKTHSFAWRMSPNSPSESTTLTKIINAFKRSAHPEILNAGAGGFYKYPNIVWIKINPDEAAANMYKFKPCVITDVNINHTPNDRPGFFGNTKSPIEVVLEIHFKEIELWRNGTNQKLLDGALPSIGDGDFNNIDLPPVRNLGNI